MAVAVTITSLLKKFDGLRAVDDVTLAIGPGELFFLLGPSGCGKTTLLRCLAGFHQPDAGVIRFGERDITGLPPHRRDTAMVFQSYALWPHMNVAENVAFGLRMRRQPRSETRRRVREALERVHMADRAGARPNQLSGGQQQRVALARALVIEPQCLLLDEPLSNLDARLRLEMREEIRRICKQAGLTAIYVTHDQKEALSVADRLAVMRAGRIEQIGTPVEVYRRPAGRFVAEFIGEGNFLPGRMVAATGARLLADTPLGRLTAPAPVRPPPAGDALTLCIRPEALRFDTPPAGAVNVLKGRLRRTVYQGEVAQHDLAVTTAAGETVLKAFELNPAVGADRAGEEVTLWIAPENVIVLPDDNAGLRSRSG
jgi:iron(III) transport system ATP-binding protein